jgi:hypothetical protein
LITEEYQDKDERIQAMMDKTREDSKKPLPKVEKFPVYFYEEGIEHFSMSCRMRQVIAMKHYSGETNYSFYDLTQEFFTKKLGKHFEGGWVKREKSPQ